MSALRRCIHTSAARSSAGTSLAPYDPAIAAGSPAIARYIDRQLKRLPPDSSASRFIPNPFLAHRSSPPAASPSSASPVNPLRTVYIPRVFSRRREKLLLSRYSPFFLPPSPLNPTASSSIAYRPDSPDEVQITWTGQENTKAAKTLYEGRRLRFKGHKHEREKPERQKDTADRLAGMDKRIEEWRKTRIGARASAKPALPF